MVLSVDNFRLLFDNIQMVGIEIRSRDIHAYGTVLTGLLHAARVQMVEIWERYGSNGHTVFRWGGGDIRRFGIRFLQIEQIIHDVNGTFF